MFLLKIAGDTCRRFPRDCGSSFPRPDPAGSPFFKQPLHGQVGGSGLPAEAAHAQLLHLLLGVVHQAFTQALLAVVRVDRDVHELDIVLFALPVVEKQVPHNPAVIQQGVVDCPLIPQQTFPVLFLPKIVREAEVVKFYDFLHPFSSQFLQLHRFISLFFGSVKSIIIPPQSARRCRRLLWRGRRAGPRSASRSCRR